MKLTELKVYNISSEIAEIIWSIVSEWDYFQKDTLGKQIVRAADSISANIAEGHGRYHYKENLKFCYYARGSLQETISWLQKCNTRGLITADEYNAINLQLQDLSVKLNNYIHKIGKKSVVPE